MKKLALGCLLATCAALAQAQTASVESVETLLVVTQARELVDNTSAQMEHHMRQGMQAAVRSDQLTERQRRLLDAMPARMAQAVQPELSWDVLKPEFVRLYRENFTQDEVEGLIRFYRSPLGQTLVAKMPAVLADSMKIMQARIAAAQPRLRQAMEAAVAELKAADAQP